MKLLFIIPSITNYFTFLEDLVNELVSRGHEVHLATSRQHIARIDSYRRSIECKVHHIDFPRALSPFKHISAARQLDKLVNRLEPDLINIHFSAALFTAMLGKKANWPKAIGTIHGLGSPLIYGWRKYAVSRAEKWSAERASEIFVLTEDDKTYLSEKATKANVSTLNSFGMGCDIDRFDPENISNVTKSRLRKEYGIKGKDFVFIFIGRQTYFKGFDKVVLAFLNIEARHKNVKLFLIGEKDRIHPSSKEQGFETLLSASENIVRVGWKENVQDFLALADVNVFPSEREGLPVNLMESLAMGVPVITSNSRGCREVVRNEIDGLILEKNDLTSLTNSMERLLQNREELEKFSSAAFEGRDRFSRK
ncbi:MAG: glycosyltransferase, partial [Flavobacteriales bacterium]|nr:glycosyltransferase [Flavobacteriales bacterium]